MSAASDLVQQWIDERDAVIDAEDKARERPIPRSVTAGSWNGSTTERGDLMREASVLRFLLRDLDNLAEAEAVAASAPAVVMDVPRSAAKAMLQQAFAAGATLDEVLDALGWPE